MKQLSARISSVLLVLALLLATSAPALAAFAVEPSLVTLDKTAATVYLHNGEARSVRLTATIQPSDFDGSVVWTVPEGSKIAITSSDKTGASVSAAAGAAAGDSGKVTVTATTGSVSKSAACTVTIKNDVVKSKTFGPFTVEAGKTVQALPSVVWESGVTDGAASGYYVDDPSIAKVDSKGNVTGLTTGSTKLHATVGGEALVAVLNVSGVEGITLNRSSLSMSVGDSAVTLTATVKPAGLNYTPVFTSSNASVAAVSSDGKVTAKGVGMAMITAKITDSSGTEYSATCTVSVTSLSGDVSVTTNANADLSFKTIYTEISSRYKKLGGSGNPTIAFSSVGSATIGTLYETSAKTKKVDSGYYGSLSLLENMCFVPAAAGRYVITYTVASSKLAGTITIEVTNAAKNIQIGLPSDAEYLLSEISSSGETGVRLISDAIGAYGSIRFGTISSASGAGTLYVTRSGSAVYSGTVVNAADVGNLYFSAGRNASYQIAYTAYSGANASGSVVASGTLTLGASVDPLNVTVSLDGVSAYTFSSSTRRSSSAVVLLRAAINADAGSAGWAYVKFNDTPGVNNCGGTLYTDSSAAYVVNANTYVASEDIGNLYFVPTQSGAFEIGYSVYADAVGASQLTSGKLHIVASNLAANSAAIYLSAAPGDTLVLRDKDFEEWYVEQRTGSYHLEYVVFNSAERSYGTLYDSGSRLVYGGAYTYYTESYYSNKSSNARYLHSVSFAAPSYAGYQEISFTAFGRSGVNGGIVPVSGVLRIYIIAGSVPDISYSFGNIATVMLKESDFAAAYRSAMAVSAASPSFYIQLMGIPDAGTLYYGYNTSTGRGTALTSSNVDLYPFYVNGGNGTEAVSKLAYVPANRGTGTYTVRYIAFSADGEPLYAGTITFKHNTETASVNVTDGYTFRLADLGADESVLYVVFDQPTLGKLYLNYVNGRGTLMPTGTRLYTANAANGAYPVTALTYIPRSDLTGSITLNYTAYTAARSYTGQLTLKTEKKTASAAFSDIPSDVASWAANAIDFASKWGLVNGTDAGAKKFSPSDTMRRCDLVLILYRNAGSPAVSGTLPYTDVPADAYYRNSALWAANNGIVSGVVTGQNYSPTGAITRQDFTRILYNYAAATSGSLSGSTSLGSFPDADQIASYAKDAMAWAVGRGYINGTTDLSGKIILDPQGKATRAQIATLLHRYLTL